ncbi:hypothetical protein EOT10_19255 [Streptomyces antnestii]|uniref:Uncharacterized protein n=1 Tax=Streptomyces antnestii TaxID=2494256 RepID=A0A437PLK5_9ACTN|nr:hypothetical protein [Streptomyces sp. San01]RVU23178.1 hypothetical protein EOT10_19255 [Streptomyces sp. San01]
MQEAIAQQPGTSSGSVQSAYQLFNGLVDELKACKNTPGAAFEITKETATTAAATVTFHDQIPGTAKLVLNEYLAVEKNSVVELAVWKATDPDGNTNHVDWTAPDGDAVLDGMTAPIR